MTPWKMLGKYYLTLKCLSYFSLPFVHKGRGEGSFGPNLRKVLFRKNFSTKLAPYVYTSRTTINQQTFAVLTPKG